MAAAPAPDVVLDVKVVVVGDSSAGKSAILTRFFDDKFEESTSFTIGIDFRHVTYQLEDGTKIRLCVWDTAGQERFRQLAPSYIRDAHVILIVFDLTAPNIVEQITRWMLFVEAEREEGAQIIFVGNKCDLKQRKLDPSVAMRMMAEYKAPYVETSAKTGFNIKEVSQCQVDLLGDLWAAARPATGSAKKRGAVPVHERTSLSATKLLPTVVKMYITSQ